MCGFVEEVLERIVTDPKAASETVDSWPAFSSTASPFPALPGGLGANPKHPIIHTYWNTHL